MNIQNLILFCQFVLKILSKNQILTGIKDQNSVANLRKTTIYNTNVDLVNDDEHTKFGLILSISSQKNQILTSIRGPNSVAKLRKTKVHNFTILMLILSMMMCIQNLVSICLFILKILSKYQILKSIKGRNSVANLRKTMIYITNLDLINDYVYTKFGLNRSICFQDIEQKLNSDVYQGP